MRAILRTMAFVLAAGVIAPAAEAGAATLCRPVERVLFSCRAKTRSISVCASRDAGLDQGYVQYRAARAGKLEMVFPETLSPPRGRLLFSQQGYAGGGESRLRFSRNGYDYFVFDRMLAGEWTKSGHRRHAMSGGVVVKHGDKIISQIKCAYDPDYVMNGLGDGIAPVEPFILDQIPND